MAELRVLHVWGEYSPDGFDETHRYCLEHGIASEVLAGTYIDGDRPPPPGVYWVGRRSAADSHTAHLAWRALRRMQRILSWPRLEALMRRKEWSFRPSLIHFHFGTTAARLVRALRGCDIPAIVSLYGVDASAVLRDPAWADRYRQMYRRASCILVLCDAVATRLREHGCAPGKTRIMNLPAGVEKYPFRERTFDGTTRFAIAARFIEKKGYPTLLRAFRRVVDQRRDVHLTMLGYGNPTLVRSLVRELDLEAFCTLMEDGLVNFPERFRRLLDQSDVFVLPSTTSRSGDDEGGPALSLVDAQAAGLPVITTRFPGSELSVIDGVTGYLAEFDDVASLSERMLDICSAPDVWARFGRAGSVLARREFSREGQCQRLLDLYREVVSEHPPVDLGARCA